MKNKRKQRWSTTSPTYNIHGNVGAIGGAGDHQQVSGTVKTTLKEAATELDAGLKKLKLEIVDSDADEALQLKALKEINEIRRPLKNIENASPDEKKTLGTFIEKIKQGSLTAFSLVEKIKGRGETLAWVTKKAIKLAGLLL